MKAINRANYEAYFLDYWEERLDANERKIVESFVAENPDLAVHFTPSQTSNVKPTGGDESKKLDWDFLKKPVELRNLSQSELADLYNRAIIDELNRDDLNIIQAEASLHENTSEWDNLKLVPNQDSMPKADLYQLDFSGEIILENYCEFLDARDAGLLSLAELSRLADFERLSSDKLKKLKPLRLELDNEIRFANKAALYRHEARVLTLLTWRTLAVAASTIGILLVWQFWPTENQDPNLADKQKTPNSSSVEVPTSLDSIHQPGQVNVEYRSGSNSTDVLKLNRNQKVESVTSNPEEKAANNIDEKHLGEVEQDVHEDSLTYKVDLAPIPLAMAADSTEIIMASAPNEEDMNDQGLTTDKAVDSDDNYLTLSELARQKLVEKLNIPDADSAKPLQYLSKRIASETGRLVGLDVSKNENSETDENEQFALRLGNFEISYVSGRQSQ